MLLEALRPGYPGEQLTFGAFKVDDFERLLTVMSFGAGGRILDLAGGFGRLARVLARAGHDVTVVELRASHVRKGELHFSGESEEVRQRVDWHVGDIREPLDFLPLDWYSGALLGHYSLNEIFDRIDAVMENVSRHLEPGGRLFVDVLPEAPYPRLRQLEVLVDHIEADGRTRWRVFTYSIPLDEDNQLHELVMLYERSVDGRLTLRHADSFRRRVWRLDEIQAAASGAGLSLIEVDGDGQYLTFEKPQFDSEGR
jgi:SAM-dependent methyltransferase